jgi:uncharacterized protein YdeI (YjbR/CyaY-like superfamily)
VIHDNPQVQPVDRSEWRAWLAEHHADARGCWVILPKRGHDGVGYAEAVEEALCFGWIDGRTQPFDEGHTRQHFAPRKKGGTWARSNKERVERLEAAGLMTDAGRAVIESAKADGSWDALNSVDDMVIPEDLAAALSENPAARTNYDAFSASVKKAYLWWIESAKRPETRAQRVSDSVWLLERGIREPKRVGQ